MDEEENEHFEDDLQEMEEEFGIPPEPAGDNAGGVTADQEEAQVPDLDDPDAWDDVVNDRDTLA